MSANNSLANVGSAPFFWVLKLELKSYISYCVEQSINTSARSTSSRCFFLTAFTEWKQDAVEAGDTTTRSYDFLQADTPAGQIMACAWTRIQPNRRALGNRQRRCHPLQRKHETVARDCDDKVPALLDKVHQLRAFLYPRVQDQSIDGCYRSILPWWAFRVTSTGLRKEVFPVGSTVIVHVLCSVLFSTVCNFLAQFVVLSQLVHWHFVLIILSSWKERWARWSVWTG